VAQQHRREQCRECLFVDSSSRPPIETDFRLRAHCTQITLVKSTKSGKPAGFWAPSSHRNARSVLRLESLERNSRSLHPLIDRRASAGYHSTSDQGHLAR
jgi:hypothetical protein